FLVFTSLSVSDSWQDAGEGEGAAGLGDLVGEEVGDRGGGSVGEEGFAQSAQVFGRPTGRAVRGGCG
ncbi:hypothetical protein, partial [Mycobacterium tuberculosis]|uniref:hypothetical protein n=1 Tax=Mycobacterium tuberculosis TaxID=1773 RepID=UPI00046486D6